MPHTKRERKGMYQRGTFPMDPQHTADERAKAAEFVRETKAVRTEAEVQRLALSPAGGWWRQKKAPGRSKRFGTRTLRHEPIMEARSVGCTPSQIAAAIGEAVTRRDVDTVIASAKRTARKARA